MDIAITVNSPDQTDKNAVVSGLLELFQNNRRWLLFFGTGTSMALDRDFGMTALQEHLSEKFANSPEWRSVDAALREGKSLELALATLPGDIPNESKSKFRKTIGDFVATVDRKHRDDVLFRKKTWIGSSLLTTLVERSPQLNPTLSVVTSNYDMLIEYACSALGVRWTTGFARGLVRSWDWDASQDRLVTLTGDRAGTRSRPYYVPLPRVELFKVHGSINRFKHEGREIECDLWVKEPPEGIERDIAVPGTLKFEQAAENMNTRNRAQQAQDQAQAFLVAGYGFADKHLHDRILDRVRREKCPLLVLTRDPSVIASELRGAGAPAWILTAQQLDDGKIDESKTTALIPGRPDAIVLDEPLWKCDLFAKRILGG